MTRLLFMLAVTVMPFTAFTGLPFLGEPSHEMSAYVFFAALCAWGASLLKIRHAGDIGRLEVSYLPQLFLLIMSVILISFIFNIESIRQNMLYGRGGLEKFLTSTAVVVYGFAVAFLTYVLAGRHAWDSLLLKPILISVGICAAFSSIEVGRYFLPPLEGLYDLLSGVVHGAMEPLPWDRRLRSVSFEPPDFANTASYFWVWLFGGFLAARGRGRGLLAAALVVLSVMIVLSGARTSLVVLSGVLGVFLVLRLFFLPPKPPKNPEQFVPIITALFGVVLPAAILITAFFFDRIILSVSTSDNVSSISRLASMVAAFKMFETSPLVGLGFGQFGFQAKAFMPSWGYLSWEIEHWFLEATNYWPAVYSLYARFAADMGVVGLAAWIGLWLWLARAVLLATLRYRQETGEVPFAAYPLIMGCAAVLLAGVPNDSVRSPMIWITMGLACRYLHDLRAYRQASQPTISG